MTVPTSPKLRALLYDKSVMARSIWQNMSREYNCSVFDSMPGALRSLIADQLLRQDQTAWEMYRDDFRFVATHLITLKKMNQLAGLFCLTQYSIRQNGRLCIEDLLRPTYLKGLTSYEHPGQDLNNQLLLGEMEAALQVAAAWKRNRLYSKVPH